MCHNGAVMKCNWYACMWYKRTLALFQPLFLQRRQMVTGWGNQTKGTRSRNILVSPSACSLSSFRSDLPWCRQLAGEPCPATGLRGLSGTPVPPSSLKTFGEWAPTREWPAWCQSGSNFANLFHGTHKVWLRYETAPHTTNGPSQQPHWTTGGSFWIYFSWLFHFLGSSKLFFFLY